jgi:hypothetical protein
MRGVAQVAALGYLGGEAERGCYEGSITTEHLLCQGTPVGCKASQPVPPSLTPLLPLGTTVQMVRGAFVKSGTA